MTALVWSWAAAWVLGRLWLAERTVETHVASVYAKIGARGRATPSPISERSAAITATPSR